MADLVVLHGFGPILGLVRIEIPGAFSAAPGGQWQFSVFDHRYRFLIGN
jgi:hypothetical protein